MKQDRGGVIESGHIKSNQRGRHLPVTEPSIQLYETGHHIITTRQERGDNKKTSEGGSSPAGNRTINTTSGQPILCEHTLHDVDHEFRLTEHQHPVALTGKALSELDEYTKLY